LKCRKSEGIYNEDALFWVPNKISKTLTGFVRAFCF
jgi:hypothetical protein